VPRGAVSLGRLLTRTLSSCLGPCPPPPFQHRSRRLLSSQQGSLSAFVDHKGASPPLAVGLSAVRWRLQTSSEAASCTLGQANALGVHVCISRRQAECRNMAQGLSLHMASWRGEGGTAQAASLPHLRAADGPHRCPSERECSVLNRGHEHFTGCCCGGVLISTAAAERRAKGAEKAPCAGCTCCVLREETREGRLQPSACRLCG
jgi:hypothetical protein